MANILKSDILDISFSKNNIVLLWDVSDNDLNIDYLFIDVPEIKSWKFYKKSHIRIDHND